VKTTGNNKLKMGIELIMIIILLIQVIIENKPQGRKAKKLDFHQQ
jgi:hypothetical protein